MPKKWSAELVVSTILEHHQKGEKLNSNHAQKNLVPLYQAACVYCGGWKQAIEAAGIPYDEVKIKERLRPKWSKEKVIEIIKQRWQNDEPLNSNYIQTHFPTLYGAANDYLGGWPQAINASGVDYETVRKVKFQVRSKDTIATAIRDRFELGLSIGGGTVAKEDPALYTAAERYFGKNAWAKARVYAGFSASGPDPRIIWTKEAVIAAIKRLHANGIALNTGAIGKTHDNVYRAGIKRFGSWSAALNVAGLNSMEIYKAHPEGWWTKTRIVRQLKRLEKRGVRLSMKNARTNFCDLLGAGVTHFGSWSQAVEAAGISYRKHALVWSTKAWLRRMSNEEYQQTLKRAATNSKVRRKKWRRT